MGKYLRQSANRAHIINSATCVEKHNIEPTAYTNRVIPETETQAEFRSNTNEKPVRVGACGRVHACRSVYQQCFKYSFMMKPKPKVQSNVTRPLKHKP